MSNTSIEPAPLLRVRGHHRDATSVVAQARLQHGFSDHTQLLALPPDQDDPIQIDPSLRVAVKSDGAPAPVPGTSYLGFTPAQRSFFLDWTREPYRDAPLAYQLLYLAHLEVNLLDHQSLSDAAHQELLALSRNAQWHTNSALIRSLLLSLWLRRSGAALASWMEETQVPSDCVEAALGLQALLSEPLHWKQVRTVMCAWIQPVPEISDETLRLRLSSLTASISQEPLQHALSDLQPAQLQPRPWRCQHRQLRFLISQPPIRRPLLSLLQDMLSVIEPVRTEIARDHIGDMRDSAKPEVGAEEDEWQLILEFGQSRSDYFELVLRECQRLPQFMQIMDEDRNMVYRIVFAKRDIRRFWRIWDYVQNWSTTRAYLNGQELEKWKIWPYSQYLR